MTQQPFRTYPGHNDIERAQAFLTATQPGYKFQSRYEQIKLAGEHVRMSRGGPEAANEAAKSERAAAGKTGTAVEKLQAAVQNDSFDELLAAAFDENPDDAAGVIEGLAQRALAKRTAKGGSAGVVAAASAPWAVYPGKNEIEQAQLLLRDKQPGFMQRERFEQIRIASAYVREFASGGQAAADRVLMARLGAA